MRANAAAQVLLVPPHTTRTGRPIPRPFLKWVGGKSQLLGGLDARMPSGFRRYFEPFVGGGALFFHRRPHTAVLSDLNQELIDCYLAIRDRLGEVLGVLRGHVYEKDHFYAVREQEPADLSPAERAARTIYLNRVGFNGLYRVNSKGRFNVPFGRYANPLICDEDNLPACSAALRNADLRVAPFEETLAQAGPGDFVYLDPPYVPVSQTASFTSYVPGGFGLREQRRLAAELVGLHGRGARFLLSNADVPQARELYASLPIPGLRIDTILASRAINSRPDARGKVSELLVSN